MRGKVSDAKADEIAVCIEYKTAKVELQGVPKKQPFNTNISGTKGFFLVHPVYKCIHPRAKIIPKK